MSVLCSCLSQNIADRFVYCERQMKHLMRGQFCLHAGLWAVPGDGGAQSFVPRNWSALNNQQTWATYGAMSYLASYETHAAFGCVLYSGLTQSSIVLYCCAKYRPRITPNNLLDAGLCQNIISQAYTQIVYSCKHSRGQLKAFTQHANDI